MTDERTGRELEPRPEDAAGAVTPREPTLPQPSSSPARRFDAGEQAHTVGLTEERAAQVVRQSHNARMIAFLGVLLVVLFIPLYWLYDIGLPVLGMEGRMEAQAESQQVLDVSRGYALYLANCARCHGNEGQGGVGPILNDQGKLYNAVTQQGLPGTGHLNPDYIHTVLEVGGRYVCGNPDSVMPAWLDPKGPLNYKEVEDIVRWIVASSDTTFVYQPLHVEAPATIPPPVTVQGWRDPNYSPPPDATPVPACWSQPDSPEAPSGSFEPVESPGTADSPRVIEVETGPSAPQWVDPETGDQITSISVVEGETIEIHVINETEIPHNMHIGAAADLEAAPEDNDLPGVPTFVQGTQTFTYSFTDTPDQAQFACTVPGHYPTMHGDFVFGAAGGSASPDPSAAASPGASPSGSPAPSEGASPAVTTQPSVSPSTSPIPLP
ncbi:MAG TPA: c-type cytochrome [Candidatus Limnocylindrales bacterium]|nr:c-type cytochrome [Candidatus Limnocylindrales bacterium]